MLKTLEQPHIIHPTGVYSTKQAIEALHLRPSSIRREVREGRLRIAKRCGRHFILGRWLLEWLEAGEKKRNQGND